MIGLPVQQILENKLIGQIFQHFILLSSRKLNDSMLPGQDSQTVLYKEL